VLETIRDVLEIFGDRPAVLAREVTKVHEEFLRGRLSELLARLGRKPPKGEMTLLIGAAPGQGTAAPPAGGPLPLAERIEQLMREQGLDRKAALKQAARERGLSKREVYKQLLLNRTSLH
jgi:16S rRNA (cytidine1402-2'-O)-methyltransferase